MNWDADSNIYPNFTLGFFSNVRGAFSIGSPQRRLGFQCFWGRFAHLEREIINVRNDWMTMDINLSTKRTTDSSIFSISFRQVGWVKEASCYVCIVITSRVNRTLTSWIILKLCSHYEKRNYWNNLNSTKFSSISFVWKLNSLTLSLANPQLTSPCSFLSANSDHKRNDISHQWGVEDLFSLHAVAV